ncbi:MAG TPA: hypothetical protein VIK43_08770 [Cellulomonas sp.]
MAGSGTVRRGTSGIGTTRAPGAEPVGGRTSLADPVPDVGFPADVPPEGVLPVDALLAADGWTPVLAVPVGLGARDFPDGVAVAVVVARSPPSGA